MKLALPLILTTAIAPGCLITTTSGDDDGGLDEQESAEGTQEMPEEFLAECREDHDVDDATQIVSDFDLSIHEMVACGGLSVTLCSSIVTGIVDAIVDNRSDATPEGWRFEGEGLYTSDAAGAEMTTRFYLATDYSFGRAGDPVSENLFEVTTYLRGARVAVDFDPSDPLAATAQLHFDAPGPYAEMLGFGAEPQSPIALSLNTWDQAQDQLGTLLFESTITVSDPQEETTVRYDVQTTRMSAAALLGAAPMEFELLGADAARADLGQELVVDDWGVEFVSGNVGALEGVVDFHVKGGPLPYLGALIYENSTYAEIDLSCP
ncbi:MAG: hypothetical protein ACRBN8_35260 [Nannocystales bacterium]